MFQDLVVLQPAKLHLIQFIRIWSTCNLHNYIYNNVLGFGLLATCIITFITMFLPKSRQMTAMGREGVFIEVISILYLVSCVLNIVYPVHPISCTSYIQYILYPVYPVSCISYILYILYPIYPISCISYILYPVHPISCILYHVYFVLYIIYLQILYPISIIFPYPISYI